jgi:hypothetical protein
MNEQIQELVKQAGGHFSTHNLMSNPVQQRESVELWDDKIEKFAELFLEESIKVMMANDYHGEWLGEKLKEHFGFKK